MRDIHRFGVLDGVLFFLVVLAATGTRFWYVSVCARNGMEDGPWQVQDQGDPRLDNLVRNLSEGRGYAVANEDEGEPVKRAHPAPLYPWLLSALFRLAPDLPAMKQLARWTQCGLAALTAGLLFLFARRAFHSLAVATLAGLLAAVYPFWIINTTEIADGVLATFLLAACLFLGARAGALGGPLTSWCYGLALAGLALCRAALLPFSFVALIGFLYRCRFQERGWLPAFLALLGFGGGLAPWVVRNFQTFQEVYPIVDTTYHHLWVGHHRDATGGPARSSADEQLTDKERGEAIWDEVKANPSGTLKRRLWAGLYFCFGEDWFHHKKGKLWRDVNTSEADEEESRVPGWLAQYQEAIMYGALLFVLLLGLLGWRWTYAWREDAAPSALALIWIPLPYLLSHAEALQGPRLPLDGVLLCYAAFAVCQCLAPWSWFSGRG